MGRVLSQHAIVVQFEHCVGQYLCGFVENNIAGELSVIGFFVFTEVPGFTQGGGQ
jgi:hypothetical protein